MLSDTQRALIAAHLRRGRADAHEGAGVAAAARRGAYNPLVELTGSGGGGGGDGRGEPAARRLFLVHAIGGTVHPYAPLATRLAPDFAVYGLQAPGLAPGSAPAASLDAMADAYLAAIRSAQPEGGPYRLSGWSMGGLVAYELARRLEQDGEKVDALVLLDAPFAMPDDPAKAAFARDGGSAEGRIAAWFVADAARTLGRNGDLADAPDPATSSAAEQLDWLAGRLDANDADDAHAAKDAERAGGAGTSGSAAGLAAAVRAEIGRRFAVFQAHTRLIAGYRPSTALHTRTLLVSARRSPNAAVASQWLALLGGPAAATVHTVDADHYEFLGLPLVVQVAAAIRDWQEAR
jgi:thioesterase domain-containing protein